MDPAPAGLERLYSIVGCGSIGAFQSMVVGMAKRQYDSSMRSRAAIEQAERARYAGLSRLAGEFGRDSDWLHGRVDDGSSVEQARADLERIESERRELAARTEIRPLPDGGAWREPGTDHGNERVAGALALMGRPDLVSSYCQANAVDPRRIRFQSVSEGLHRLVGAMVPNAYDLHRVVLEVSTMRTWEGVPAAFPRAGLGPAVRDAALHLLQHDWGARRGAFWRTASRVIPTGTTKTTRAYVAASGGVGLYRIGEAGEAQRADPGHQGWPYADLVYPEAGRGLKFFPTVEQIVNAGLEPISSWLSGVVAGWNDDFDQLAVTALADAPANAGGFDDAHLAAALSALNRQAINGRTLGSASAFVLAGEGRRGAIGGFVPGLPRASGDATAVLERVEYSSAVASNTAILVHGRFAPLAVGYLDAPEPTLNIGSLQVPGGATAIGVMVQLNVTDPTAIRTSDTARAPIGALRLTASE